MALEDIAAGVEVTSRQRDRGVATVDETETSLVERIEPHASELPCTAQAAATILESYEAGNSIGSSARAAGVAPMTAARTLYRCGTPGVCPLSSTNRQIVRDWIAGELGRAEAVTLTGAGDAEFALTTYIETHDPVPELVDAVASVGSDSNPTIQKRDALAETMSDVSELL